jgi:hypothetical protein
MYVCSAETVTVRVCRPTGCVELQVRHSYAFPLPPSTQFYTSLVACPTLLVYPCDTNPH